MAPQPTIMAASVTAETQRAGPILRLIGFLPLPILYGIGALLALIVRYGLRYRVGVARDNLRRCFPHWPAAEIQRVLNEHYRRQGELAAEILKLAAIGREPLRARIRYFDFAPVHAHLAAGQSVLLLTSHQCNWEWLLQTTAMEAGMPFFAAYKPPSSAAADRSLLRLRGRFGVHMLSGKRLLRELARQRRQTHAVGMMADQMPTTSAGRVWLSFLGRETAFFPGPAEIARICGYPAYFVGMRRVRRGFYESRLEPIAAAGEVLDATQFTARYAACIEAEVKSSPADWAWTHRRWKFGREPPTVSDGGN
jgi:Kdo2-lipid IVA lauroyltransferase/acyltransferase